MEHTKYMTTTQTIHLQGIGNALAKTAGELQVGDTLTWNYGYQYTVVSIEPCGAKSVKVVEENAKGQRFTRRMLRTRLVAA